jgi:hypothetical protein
MTAIRAIRAVAMFIVGRVQMEEILPGEAGVHMITAMQTIIKPMDRRIHRVLMHLPSHLLGLGALVFAFTGS